MKEKTRGANGVRGAGCREQNASIMGKDDESRVRQTKNKYTKGMTED